MKSQQQSNEEVQVTESQPQQSSSQQNKPYAEQTKDDLEDNNGYESDLEDLLVSILDEMTVIKKMLSQQQQNRSSDEDTKHKVEKLTIPPKEQLPNALDFSNCF